MLAQMKEAAETAEGILNGRSEPLVVILVGMALVALVMWWMDRRYTREDEQSIKRDEQDLNREIYQRTVTDKLVATMQTIGAGSAKTSEAMTQIANAMDTIGNNVEDMQARLGRVETAVRDIDNKLT